MCCQPPSKIDDIERNWNRNIQLIDSAPLDLPSIGITGGEPTLLGDKFFDLVKYIRERLPNTEIHILSNGRAFADKYFASRLSQLDSDLILFGIPLHSDNQLDHDAIAGAPNAFTETLKGLYNLARYSFDIELRIVITKMNYRRLPQMASFIFKNLPFVRYVSLMGLEYTGYSIKNADKVWIDPVDLQEQLCKAVQFLSMAALDVSIFNYSHCVLPGVLWPFARKSISDWKVRYEPFCDDCEMKMSCCGLFATSKKQSQNIHPIKK